MVFREFEGVIATKFNVMNALHRHKYDGYRFKFRVSEFVNLIDGDLPFKTWRRGFISFV